jgi:hypothetical protein
MNDGGFSFFDCIVLMAADFVLYGVLAWYLDQVSVVQVFSTSASVRKVLLLTLTTEMCTVAGLTYAVGRTKASAVFRSSLVLAPTLNEIAPERTYWSGRAFVRTPRFALTINNRSNS